MTQQRATPDTFSIYRRLMTAETWLPMDPLEPGREYLLYARNAYHGVWKPEVQGFVILREKLGRRYLFTEYHWDTGEPNGTVKPFALMPDALPYDLNDAAGTFARLDVFDQRYSEAEQIAIVDRARAALAGESATPTG